MPDPLEPEDILRRARVIAVVGCSANADRMSHTIARYLQQAGYRVIPVNPGHDEILGEVCYPDLVHIPAALHIDIVNVFRNRSHTEGVVVSALARAAATGEWPVIWTQYGVSSPEAEQRAADAGLPYVRNRCIKIDHARLES
jgi:uncharacterized protein